jgi:hypothetical protein
MSTIAPPVRAYELWYEYLKETDPDTWSDEVRRDFGGVLTSKSFEEWFSAEIRFKLFPVYGLKEEDLPVRNLSGKKDEAWISDWLHRMDDLDEEADDPSKYTVLVINRNYPRAMLMEKIERILSRKQPKKKAGRPEWQAPFSKYTFARRPDISSLEIALAAYQIKKRGIPNWQVGNELAKSFPILQEQRIRGEHDPDEIAKKKALESAASRYLKSAAAVQAGVVCGIFPAK